jgi:hypothetical protein
LGVGILRQDLPDRFQIEWTGELTLVDRLAMYYNGYILICIFIGAYIGSFVFQWETLADG